MKGERMREESDPQDRMVLAFADIAVAWGLRANRMRGDATAQTRLRHAREMLGAASPITAPQVVEFAQGLDGNERNALQPATQELLGQES